MLDRAHASLERGHDPGLAVAMGGDHSFGLTGLLDDGLQFIDG